MKSKKKKYSLDDFYNLPHEVLFLKVCEYTGYPVGISLYEQIIAKYPEHFPEETEHRKRWNSIPQYIHDAYWNEYWEYDKLLRKDEPKFEGGLRQMMDYTESYQKWKKFQDEVYPLIKKKEKELHKKYYFKYLGK